MREAPVAHLKAKEAHDVTTSVKRGSEQEPPEGVSTSVFFEGHFIESTMVASALSIVREAVPALRLRS